VAWDQIVWCVAKAFKNCETSDERDTLKLRRHVQEQLCRWAMGPDHTAVRKRISAVVPGHPVARPPDRLMRPPPLPVIDFVSRPDRHGRPLLWRAWEENKLGVVVDFVVDLMGKDEAHISSADKFRVLVALLSPGPIHWPANPAPAVQVVIYNALRDALDTAEASLFSDELSDLTVLMLPHAGRAHTVFAESLKARDREDALRMVRTLLQHRYSHVPRHLHRLDRQRQTLLHLAVRHDRDDVLSQLFTSLAGHPLPPSHKVRVLHDLLFTKNGEGFTVLSHALHAEKAAMAERLVALLRGTPILDPRRKTRWLKKMGVPPGQP
jgi:hypothetical protein